MKIIRLESQNVKRLSAVEITPEGAIIVIGGRVPEFNEITPLMYLHNVYGENYSNVIFGFDTSIVPCRNIQVYGEFAMDDIR
ncbi:hypothetical protein LCGC14_2153630, partial [marine sediment metagenome]